MIRTTRRMAMLAGPAVLSLTLSAPAAAFEPAVEVKTGGAAERLVAADVASRSGDVFATIDSVDGSFRNVHIRWSDDQGATWDGTSAPDDGARESAATTCDGEGAMAYASADDAAPATWAIMLRTYTFDGFGSGGFTIAADGMNRRPDIACIADQKVAIAWFRPHDGGHQVRLYVRLSGGEDLSPQSFTVGTGSVSKGLAVAATSQRVYVAWFQGNALKLRQYAVGPSPDLTLSSLGTATILTSTSARDPKLAASGNRVVLAYQHQGDLRTRRSTDRGVTFRSAVTVNNVAFPSEVAVSPTTLAMSGKRVVMGALRVSGVETLAGKGFGYLSPDGGATWTTQATHGGGRTLATLVLVSGSQTYAEVWDESIADPDPEEVRFRRK